MPQKRQYQIEKKNYLDGKEFCKQIGRAISNVGKGVYYAMWIPVVVFAACVGLCADFAENIANDIKFRSLSPERAKESKLVSGYGLMRRLDAEKGRRN